jgi:hypothetical protein
MARQKMWPDGKAVLEQVARNSGRGRKTPPIDEEMQEIFRKPVFVFNVGPWGFRENGGSFGYHFIPACTTEYYKDEDGNVYGAPMEWELVERPPAAPGVYVPDTWVEGKRRVTDPRTEYAACRPLPGRMAEPMPLDMQENIWNIQDSGKYFADEVLLKIGKMHSKQESNVRLGVFRATGRIPTQAELAAARAELALYMAERVREADLAWSQGPLAAEQVIRPQIHHICAQWLNLEDRDWLRGTKPQGRVKCEMCGLLVDSGIATCQNGHIVDAEAYKRAWAQQKAIKEALGA